jgi:uncharacterized membrane protein (DUF373 family)
LRGRSLEVEAFIEVAMIVVLRKLIVMPVEDGVLIASDVAYWVGAGLMLGIMYFIVRWANKLQSETEEKENQHLVSEDINLHA